MTNQFEAIIENHINHGIHHPDELSYKDKRKLCEEYLRSLPLREATDLIFESIELSYDKLLRLFLNILQNENERFDPYCEMGDEIIRNLIDTTIDNTEEFFDKIYFESLESKGIITLPKSEFSIEAELDRIQRVRDMCKI